jgi:voltage-gated sodium channel
MPDYPDQNFDSFFNAALTLVVLLTTENYPGVLHPAYDHNAPVAVVFFWSFIMLAIWLLMSVVLAVVFASYERQSAGKKSDLKTKEHEALLLAYHILKDDADELLDATLFRELMAHVRPEASESENLVLFHCMDDDATRTIEIGEFLHLTGILRARVERVDVGDGDGDGENQSGDAINADSVAGGDDQADQDADSAPFTWQKCCECLCTAAAGRDGPARLQRVVDRKWFRTGEQALMSFNALVLVLHHSRSVTHQHDEFHAFNIIQQVFCVLFLLECAVKVSFLGSRLYVREFWFDGISAVGSAVSEVVYLVGPVRTIPVRGFFRALRVLRLYTVFPRLRRVVFSLYSCFRPIFVLFGLIVCIAYIYLMIGMEVFHDQRRSKLPYENFGSASVAALALHQITVSNNWNDILYDQITLADHSLLPAFYFLSFYFLVLWNALNVLIALIVDEFTRISEMREKRAKKLRANQQSVLAAAMPEQQQQLSDSVEDDIDAQLDNEIDEVAYFMVERSPVDQELIVSRIEPTLRALDASATGDALLATGGASPPLLTEPSGVNRLHPIQLEQSPRPTLDAPIAPGLMPPPASLRSPSFSSSSSFSAPASTSALPTTSWSILPRAATEKLLRSHLAAARRRYEAAVAASGDQPRCVVAQIWRVRGYGSWLNSDDGAGNGGDGGAGGNGDNAGDESEEFEFAALRARLEQTEKKLRMYQQQ